MSISPPAVIKPVKGRLCKEQTRFLRRSGSFLKRRARPAGLLLWLACGFWSSVALATGSGAYETWSADGFTLTPRESIQIKVTYDQIQVRNWKLVVEGGDQNCDLLVTRTRDQALLYQFDDQRYHEVLIPWGKGEEVSIVITNRKVLGTFVVTLLGPPRDQVLASYSYHVNRALDKFAAGQRLAAEGECRKALLADPDDSVAKVLLAGFMRDRNYYDRAAVLVDEALAGDLPDNMREIASAMRNELVILRAPLPLPVRRGVEETEDLLLAGRSEDALALVEKLLDGDLELDTASRSRLLMLRGQALDRLGRNFESLDAFTNALQLNRTKAGEGIIYFHMGRLFLKMDNLPQARGAYTMALQAGLPSGLDVQAREAMQTIEARLLGER